MFIKDYLKREIKQEILETEFIIKDRISINNDTFSFEFFDVTKFDVKMNEANWDSEDRENQNFDVGKLYGLKFALNIFSSKKVQKHFFKISSLKKKISESEYYLEKALSLLVEFSGNSKEEVYSYDNVKQIVEHVKSLKKINK